MLRRSLITFNAVVFTSSSQPSHQMETLDVAADVWHPSVDCGIVVLVEEFIALIGILDGLTNKLIIDMSRYGHTVLRRVAGRCGILGGDLASATNASHPLDRVTAWLASNSFKMQWLAHPDGRHGHRQYTPVEAQAQIFCGSTRKFKKVSEKIFVGDPQDDCTFEAS